MNKHKERIRKPTHKKGGFAPINEMLETLFDELEKAVSEVDEDRFQQHMDDMQDE